MAARKRQGFTLIELSIVLVIIGLLVGGVLVGRDLIRAAQIRMQAAQIEKLNTAANTFKAKYKCLPGDCATAVTMGLGVTAGDGDNGNGNGYIDSGSVTALDGTEIRNFWIHLSNAHLIAWAGTGGAVPGVNSPPLIYTGQGTSPGGMWLVSNGGNASLPAQMNSWILTNISTGYNPIYMPAEAFALDTKIDDGLPATGVMTSMGMFDSTSCSGSCTYAIPLWDSDSGLGTTCINDLGTPIRYDLTTTVINYSALCEPVVRWNF